MQYQPPPDCDPNDPNCYTGVMQSLQPPVEPPPVVYYSPGYGWVSYPYGSGRTRRGGFGAYFWVGG